jgi:putative transposase
MRLVGSTVGVARSHLVALLKRPDAWTDRRTARSRADDTALLEGFGKSLTDSALTGIDGCGAYCDTRIPG